MPIIAPTSTASGPKIRFNTKVLAVEFDDEPALWRVQTDPGGEITARFLVNASGVLTVPKLPDIDGVDSFGGTIMHTARWDHTQDLTGKRVAVIGTGASAVQLIPEIAPIVSELTVFQRTPIWCFPKFDVPLPQAGALGDAPARRQGGSAADQPGLRRGDLSPPGAVLHGVPAGQVDGVGRPRAICACRSGTRRCASNSPRSTRSAANGPASTTPTCRRSTATMCDW